MLEVAAIFGAGQQGAHVERIDHRILEDLRHFAIDDALGQAFGDRGLADAGLTDQQRIVLAPTAQGLDHPFEFILAADQGIDLALGRGFVEILRVLLKRALLALVFLLGFLIVGLVGASLFLFRRLLGDAVRNIVHHIEPGDALLVQVVDRVRVLLAEDRHKYIGAGDFLLAVR